MFDPFGIQNMPLVFFSKKKKEYTSSGFTNLLSLMATMTIYDSKIMNSIILTTHTHSCTLSKKMMATSIFSGRKLLIIKL